MLAWFPSIRFPALRWHTDEAGPEQHRNRIQNSHDHEGFGNSDGRLRFEMGHEFHPQRRADKSAAAESHDRHARCHAGAVGEPFDQRGNGRDVAESETNVSDDAVTEIKQPKNLQLHTDG